LHYLFNLFAILCTIDSDSRSSTALNIPEHFLTNSPDTWDSDNDYIDGQRKVRSSKDVNDAAE